MVRKHFHRIHREDPVAARRIVSIAALIVTGVIIVAWFLIFPFFSLDEGQPLVSEELQEDLDQLGVIVDEGFGNLGQQLDEIQAAQQALEEAQQENNTGENTTDNNNNEIEGGSVDELSHTIINEAGSEDSQEINETTNESVMENNE